jgi:hypothetical protein
MNQWAQRTANLAANGNYLDQLQIIYPNETRDRAIDEVVLQNIRQSFDSGDTSTLLNTLLDLEKFPFKDSYVDFLRTDRSALERNPLTVNRICQRLLDMGIEDVIQGALEPKESNRMRGNQFRAWARNNFNVVELNEFRSSTQGIIVLGGSDLDAIRFCNNDLGLGITKRPDIVAKVGARYVAGEAKFSSASGGNQNTGFDDGIGLATKSTGNAFKIFALDGVVWLKHGTAQYRRIDNSNAVILSALLLPEYLQSL